MTWPKAPAGGGLAVDSLAWRDLRRIVLIATKRILNGEPSIAPMTRRAMIHVLVRDAVLGDRLDQGLEYFVHCCSPELAGKLPLLARRARLAARLARRAETFGLRANRDPAATRATVRRFPDGRS